MMKVLFISFIYFIKIRPIKHTHVKKKTENTMAKRKKGKKMTNNDVQNST